MAKCPKCKTENPNPTKTWKYGIFTVKMYKCNCGNKFREYYKNDKISFILSAHDGTLGGKRQAKRKS